MTGKNSFVAILKDNEKAAQAFVVDGDTTINQLWTIINDRVLREGGFSGLLSKPNVRHVSLHRDEAAAPTREEELSDDMKFLEQLNS